MKKTALVTGGAGGIGEAIVRRLCADSFTVVINYFSSEEKAKALSSELVLSGFDCFAVKADVSDEKQVESMISQIVEKTGGIDVLVNNSGVALQKLFDLTSAEEWQKIQSVNLTGTFNCAKAVVPHMISGKYGRIINISSMWGQVGASCEVAYSAAKAGVIGLTKALAKELAPSGITVNAIAPGLIETNMNSNLSIEELSDFVSEIPLGRMGSADEIAAAIEFLASDKADYITGQILGINGGFVV